jgi:hypothetical protein
MEAANVQTTLRATFEECGLPDYLLIDHGTPWYNTWNPWGWTELTVWILRQGIQIILSGVRHPQTQGKVERMHEALQRAIRKRHANADQQDWLDEFRQQYNHVRPHEGIGMAEPASRWQPSPRPFQPQPPEWTYPKGWEDHRLSGEGRLNWLGQCWPISGALRNQHVGLERTGDRVLVHFCNLTLCEIDLLSGRSVTFPANPFRHLHG